MKDLEKMLREEFDSRIKPMSQELKSYPITTEEISKPKLSMWKVLVPTMSFLVVIALIVIVISLPKPNDRNKRYVIDVNPSIVISTDSEDKVTSIKSANNDGDLILFGLDIDALIGKNIIDVSLVIADEYIKLGYLSDNKQMNISTVNVEDDAVEDALVDFFCEKGYFVAVFAKELNLESYNQNHNTNLKSIDEFETYIEKLKTLEIDNSVSSDLSKEEIEKIYKEEYLKENLEALINNEYNNIIASQNALSEIYKTYYEILADSSINYIIKDYWYLLDKYDNLSQSAQKLMDYMQSQLNNYYNLTGNEINGIEDLLDFEEIVNTFTTKLANLSQLLSELSEALINDAYEDWMNKLNNAIDNIDISVYIDIPSTCEELNDKVKSIYSDIKNELINDNKFEYEKEKEAISEQEYKNFINSFNKN